MIVAVNVHSPRWNEDTSKRGYLILLREIDPAYIYMDILRFKVM